MRSLFALVFLVGCGASEREIEIVNALPGCLGGARVDEVTLHSLGDFAPQSSSVAPGSTMQLALPGGTRVVEIDGLAAGGLVAFGRSAPFFLGALGPRVAVHYGPPDALCATGRMRYARAGHRATALVDGSVLLSGGWDTDGFAVPKLEVYSLGGEMPGTFRVVDPTGPTAIDARAAAGHAVTRLPSGGLVVTGGAPVASGRPNGIATEGMLRLGADGAQRGAATLLPGGPRAFHSASALPDGRVLLLGGCSELSMGECAPGRALDGALLFDPELGGVDGDAPKLRRARWGHQAIERGDGTFLVVGGRGEGALFPPPEIYDPTAPRGLDAGTVSAPAAKLPTGAVLAVGGTSAASTEATLWLGATEAEALLASLPAARSGHTVTALEDGSVLVAGGGAGSLDAALVILDAQGTVTSVPGAFSRRQHTSTRLDDGTVLLAGGEDGRGSTTEAAIFLRSPLGPFASLPLLGFDGAAEPLVPRRADRARVTGQLIVEARARGEGGRPGELVLVGGVRFADFLLSVTVEGAAAILFAHAHEASYAFVALEAGAPVTLSSVSSPGVGQTLVSELCRGEPLGAGDSALFVSYKSGTFDVYTVERTLLRCAPRPAPERGAIGLGALFGTARFDNLTIAR